MRRYWSYRWLSIVLLLSQFHDCAANFTFTYSEATQCDDFEVSWQGGTGSFQLILLPEFGTTRILDIPDSSFSNNDGSYKTTMVLTNGTRMLAMMSDSSGFASGGVSSIFTVGKQIGETQCNVTDPGVAFYYDNDNGVSQCQPYKFYNYPNAVQPITIKGAVPGGNSFILNPPNGAQTFQWTADVAAGTVVAMYMEDAQGRQGGVTNFMTVGISDVNQCLDSNSPSSLANAPSMTSTSTSPSLTTVAAPPNPSNTAHSANQSTSRTNVPAIVGGVVGGVVVLTLLGLLAWFCLRRRRRITVFGGGILGRHSSKEEIDLTQGFADHPSYAVFSPYTLYSDNPDPSTLDSSSRMLNRPRADGGPPTSTSTVAPASASSPHVRHLSSSSTGSNDPLWPEPSPTHAARSGHSLAARDLSVTVNTAGALQSQTGATPSPQRLTRVILHTDLEDDPPPPVEEEEIIELPPQYTERRAPPANAAVGLAVGAGSRATASGPGRSARKLSTAKPKR